MPEDPRKAELLEHAQAHLFRSAKDYGEPIIARGRGATLVDTDGKVVQLVSNLNLEFGVNDFIVTPNGEYVF